MPYTQDQIREQLKRVLDPELGVSIVDLGLIYTITIQEKKIHILMTLTTPGCPLGGTIIAMMRDALASLEGVNPEQDVTVEITFDPPWTIECMSEEAKASLGF